MSKEPPSDKNKAKRSSGKRGPHETKCVLVDQSDESGRQFKAERWGSRYLFIGPLPGKFLFTSFEADSWDLALIKARREWNTKDKTRRNVWHGLKGRFTEFCEWGTLRGE